MKLYTLKNSELMKLNREFCKTSFGRRARIFSLLPCLLFVGFYFWLYFGNDFNPTDLILVIIGCCITQMQYGNMLRDYINSKN